jgi:hypothetical protein
MASCHTLDQVDTCFDDTHAVANAGLLLAATLAERLGIEQATDQLIDLGQRAGAAHPGRKLLTLVHAMLAGGTASTTPCCCAVAPPARCSATASWPLHPGDVPPLVHLRAHPSARPAHRTAPHAGVGGWGGSR